MGVTEVIGSTPVDIDLVELLDEGQDGVELALEVRHLLLGDGDPRKMRDAPDGRLIDGHSDLLKMRQPSPRPTAARLSPRSPHLSPQTKGGRGWQTQRSPTCDPVTGNHRGMRGHSTARPRHERSAL